MKTVPTGSIILLIVGALATKPIPGCQAAEPAGKSGESQENLGYDIYEGKTNKIARVHSANAVSVLVIYEGNTGGRKIPRQDLPPELQAKYPYDPAKAAEVQQQQSAL